MMNILIYILISLSVLSLAIIRLLKKKIRLFNFIILAVGAFIPTINTGLLVGYILWVILFKGDKPHNLKDI